MVATLRLACLASPRIGPCAVPIQDRPCNSHKLSFPRACEEWDRPVLAAFPHCAWSAAETDHWLPGPVAARAGAAPGRNGHGRRPSHAGCRVGQVTPEAQASSTSPHVARDLAPLPRWQVGGLGHPGRAQPLFAARRGQREKA